MNRREFLRGVMAVPAAMSGAAFFGGCEEWGLFDKRNSLPFALPSDGKDLPKPTGPQVAWQNAEVGILFSYDLHVFDGKRYYQPRNRKTPIKDINMFNPTEYNMDQWIESAVDMGAKFAILTASHETGFRLWQSDANPYCMKALKWQNGKGDLVRDFVKACRKHKIQPGIYMGTRWNSHLGVLNFRVQEHCPLTQEQYNKLIEREVEEICSWYGPLFELWFDGGILAPSLGGPDVLPIFEKYQPNCIFYHSMQRSDVRWGGTETGTVGYPCWSTMPFKGSRGHTNRNLLRYGDPDGKFWSPAMADAPLRNHEWFWEPNDERKIYSLKALQNMYYKSVGRNATLILGITPDPRGLVPDADRKRMAEFGRWVRESFSKPIAKTAGTGNEITLKLTDSKAVNHVIIQEYLPLGQRIRKYKIEALMPGGKWDTIAQGSSVGNKRIEQFAEVKTAALKLTVTESAATPVVSNFAAYSVNV